MDSLVSILKSFSGEFASAIVGLIVGYILSRLRERYKRWQRARSAGKFFGIGAGRTTVVHSAVFDESRKAYDLPACDTTAARHVVSVFQRCGLREDIDYTVAPDVDLMHSDGSFPAEVLQGNLVLICSPKRNRLTEKLLAAASYLRYQMCRDKESSEIQIRDTRRQTTPLVSSRDSSGVTAGESEGSSGHDFALIASLPNPFNQERRAIVLAGIHGTGTLGAARFVADEKNLRDLLARKEHGIVQQIVRVDYSGSYENVTDITLA